MNIIEAIKSGNFIKRPQMSHWIDFTLGMGLISDPERCRKNTLCDKEGNMSLQSQVFPFIPTRKDIIIKEHSVPAQPPTA